MVTIDEVCAFARTLPRSSEAFVRGRGTLYLIAEATDEESPLAPLFACLATEIHRTAALVGSQLPGCVQIDICNRSHLHA